MFDGCETGASYAVGIPTSVGMIWLCQFCRDKVLKFVSQLFDHSPQMGYVGGVGLVTRARKLGIGQL